jgi:hypothetical protein
MGWTLGRAVHMAKKKYTDPRAIDIEMPNTEPEGRDFFLRIV